MSEQIAQEGRGIKSPRPLLVCTRFLQGLSVFSADFTSSVISVLEGDTIEVLHTQHPERICLSGIDCPEKGQAFGHKAKEAASTLAFGKEVTLQTHGLTSTGAPLVM